jgi:cystathionine gamma-synthase
VIAFREAVDTLAPMIDPDVHPATFVVAAGRPAVEGDPLSHGIAPASNFRSGGERWYVRPDGTETISAFETVIGGLEGGIAVSYATGMAACAAAISLLPPGARVAHCSDLYHGVAELLAETVEAGRIELTAIHAGDTAGWKQAVQDHDLVWLETPTNPLLDVAELDEICAMSERRALVAVDSTFATPLAQRPLRLGADIVVHSATKFIGGHSDLMAGVVVVSDTDIHTKLLRHRLLHGAVPGALEVFLALRGVRTLAVRLERSSDNAAVLADRLAGHPAVSRVRYPGRADHPGHEAAAGFMTGFGAVVSFELADDDTADRFLASLDLITHATSLGGVETTAERRSGYPGSEHIPAGLVRMSVGCENVEDLWVDLDRALSNP